MTETKAINPDKEIAEIAKINAETAKLKVEAEAARLKALVPDLSTVKGATVVAPKEGAISATLAYRAMQAAAGEVVKELGESIADNPPRILVTSNLDLASAASAFFEVDAAIEAVLKHAEAVINPNLFSSTSIGGVIASALPGILSMLSVNRSITISSSEKNDVAAAALVAGKFLRQVRKWHIVHDEFRLPQRGGIWDRLDQLYGKRHELIVAKRGLKKSAEADGREAEIDVALGAIDALEAKLRSSEGAARSPLANAALYEVLFAPRPKGQTRAPIDPNEVAEANTEGEPPISHVLLVKSEGGQVVQTIADRPLWGEDKVTLIAEAAITYMLLETKSSRLVAAGTVSGVAQAMGNIGGKLEIVLDP